MNLRRRMRRLELEAEEVLAGRGTGAGALGRKASVFMVETELRNDYAGTLADPARREARYRERLVGYGLEFVEEHDRPNLEYLESAVVWLEKGRRARPEGPRRGQSDDEAVGRGRRRRGRFL